MAATRSSAPAVPEFETPAGMERLTFSAMGTHVTVLAPASALPAAAPLVRSLFEEWEGTLSRFRPESELSYVNARAGRPVIVSTLFAAVLTAALQAARATDGIYDPTMLRQLEHAGYDRTFTELPASGAALPGAPQPGGQWRAVRYDPYWRAVTVPAGVALDFGGIAKGMAVDAAIERLMALHLGPATVEAGGDLRVVGVPPGLSGWPVAVKLPAGVEMITLYEGSLATSSRSRRQWKRGEHLLHHILDPRSGEPAESGLWSVTAIAPRCAQADVAAKVSFILGRDAGTRFLSDHGLSGLMVTPAGERLRVGLWQERQPERGR